MPAKEVNFEWTIRISPDEENNDLLLSVDVDSPQEGASTVTAPSGKIYTGDIQALPLGNGSSLHGKSMKIVTLVTDFDPNSNATGITVSVGGHQVTYNENVDAEKGSVYYKIKVNFV